VLLTSYPLTNSYSNASGGFCLWRWSCLGVKITHLHPVPRVTVSGAIPLPTMCLHGMDTEFTFYFI